MTIKNIARGMKVKIDEKCEKTNDRYTVVGKMHRYLGSIQTVDFVTRDDSVEILGFTWHIDDISFVEDKIIERKPELFNPENIY